MATLEDLANCVIKGNVGKTKELTQAITESEVDVV
jgi:hypothetical protein